MEFNQRLLRGIAEEHHGIAKIILFCLDTDINAIYFADQKHWKTIQDITNRLSHTGAIMENPMTGLFILNMPLFVEAQVSALDISSLRLQWSKKNLGEAGKMGDPVYVKELVIRLMQSRGWTLEQMTKAANRYIAECRRTGRLIRDIQNFLIDDSGNSMIAAYIEEEEEEETPEYNSFL